MDSGGTVSGVVNSYYAPPASVSAAANTIALGSLRAGGGPAVAAGDLLQIIQMQGTTFKSSNNDCYGDGNSISVSACGTTPTSTGDPARGYTGTPIAGTYEYARVTAVSAGIASLASGLLNAYTIAAPTASGTNASGTQTFQIIRVPQNAAITVDSAAPVLPLAWNGQTGGVLALDVAGVSTFTGAGTQLSAAALGFRCGWGNLGNFTTGISDYARNAEPTGLSSVFDTTKGEGIAGTPRHEWTGRDSAIVIPGPSLTNGYPGGDFGRDAPGNAGGGGGNGGRGGSGGNT